MLAQMGTGKDVGGNKNDDRKGKKIKDKKNNNKKNNQIHGFSGNGRSWSSEAATERDCEVVRDRNLLVQVPFR